MYKTIVLCAFLWVSGCGTIGVQVWDNSGMPTQGECPDTNYDNGGSIKPAPGMCKMGTGVLFSTVHHF